MKLNDKELAHFAETANGRSDKEGILWIKENDGKLKKKGVHNRRWFKLIGNLLFYLKSEVPTSPVYGLVVLLQSSVEVDREDPEVSHSFRITFEHDSSVYFLAAENAQEMSEWMLAIKSVGYTQLLNAVSELRAKIYHLSCVDPIPAGNPLSIQPFKTLKELQPAVGPSSDEDPLLNLSLACSSLVSARSNSLPSALIITNTKTPPQSYWVRYAQTEVVEHTCDPRFFTTVVLTTETTLASTQLKFEVFDVYDRNNKKMIPLGNAECSVQDLLQSPNFQVRVEIRQGAVAKGFLNVLGWKESRDSPQRISTGTATLRPLSAQHSGFEDWRVESGQEGKSGSLRLPFNRLMMTKFQFPVAKAGEPPVKVSEVMGEGLYSWTVPRQMLQLLIADDNRWLSYFQALGTLQEEWEMNRQDVMLELSTTVSYYRDVLKGMDQKQADGYTFKKSTEKRDMDYEFVPTNLHVQYMRVELEDHHAPLIAYEVVTVGAPTSYSLKYKHGGLMRWHQVHPYSLANHYDNHVSGDSRTCRGKAVLGHIERSISNIHSLCENLLDECDNRVMVSVQKVFYELQTEVYQLRSHCSINLVDEALVEMQGQTVTTKDLPWSLLQKNLSVSLLFDHVDSKLAHLSGQLTSLECQDPTDVLEAMKPWRPLVQSAADAFLNLLYDVTETLHRTVYYIFLKDAHELQYEKVPLGVRGYRHRRDICFSHAVTTLATSFATKMRQAAVDASFGNQLSHVGFLVYWESLLSTYGEEMGMLEDFYIAVQDLNNTRLRIVCGDPLEGPTVRGTRYKVTIQMPLEDTLFRLFPIEVQKGQELEVCVILFTQGINEQQSLADHIGDNTLQDTINVENYRVLQQYVTRYKEVFALADTKVRERVAQAEALSERLLAQVSSRKHKNTEIFTTMHQMSRLLNAARVTSCKSAKDRTAMAVTLEQAHILLNDYNMDPTAFQHALDTMRSQGTRIHNSMKNVGQPLYAFNVLQLTALPRHYRPPDGTYKKLPT